MPELRWTGRGYFSHPDHGLIDSGETIHVDDEDEAEDLLGHYSEGWERAENGDAEANTQGMDEESTAEESTAEESNEGNDDGGMDHDDADMPDEDDLDDEPEFETYPRDELESMEYSTLRELAMDSDHPDVNGRSSGDEIIEALSPDV